MNQQPLITIYTQAYNSGLFIEQCIKSVLEQTYTNFEYYICNHGSKDNTLEIIEKYASIDKRIHVMDMPNSARGFYPEYICQHAKGDYFAMLDSDDYWHNQYLEKLVEFASHNDLDIAICGVYKFMNEKPDEITVLRQIQQSFVYDVHKENGIYFSYVYDFLRTTWGKLTKLSVIRKADFSTYRINAQTFISDDTAFSLANYEKSSKVGMIPDCLLYYRFSDNSVTAKYNTSLLDNNCNILKQSLDLLDNISDESLESQMLIQRVFWGAMYSTVSLLCTANLSLTEKLVEFNRILSNECFVVLSENRMIAEREISELIVNFSEILQLNSLTLDDNQIIQVKKIVDYANQYFSK